LAKVILKCTVSETSKIKSLIFISFWLQHVPVNLKGSRITKDASLKSGAVKAEITAIIGEMSAAASLISPAMCGNLIYSFVSFAA